MLYNRQQLYTQQEEARGVNYQRRGTARTRAARFLCQRTLQLWVRPITNVIRGRKAAPANGPEWCWRRGVKGHRCKLHGHVPEAGQNKGHASPHLFQHVTALLQEVANHFSYRTCCPDQLPRVIASIPWGAA